MPRTSHLAAASLVLLALHCPVSGQSTPEQEQAAAANAETARLNALGQYNYNAAAAAVEREKADAAALENSSTGVREWYSRKQMNADYLAAKNPLPSPGLAARVAELKRPDRLTLGQYSRREGKLNWPAIFRFPLFDEERIALDEAFAQRGAFDAGTDSEFYRLTNAMCKRMREKMADAIVQMTSADSISGRKFLRSLEYEARILPSDMGGLVINQQ